MELINARHQVIVVDDLSNARIDVLDRIEEICGRRPEFYRMDCADKNRLQQVFIHHRIDAVIHFAGFKAVGESVKKPLAYYRNNLDSTMTLLEVMEEFGCRKLVFSSSATVYGPDKPDGTCQRDYLHVVDLAIGHLKALEYAESNHGAEAINLGSHVHGGRYVPKHLEFCAEK